MKPRLDGSVWKLMLTTMLVMMMKAGGGDTRSQQEHTTPHHHQGQQQQEPTRFTRQTLLGNSGCPDAELFNYLLYYYLIQAQTTHQQHHIHHEQQQQQHNRADGMASALLQLKSARGTDPVPTLISTEHGQSALLQLLQNVAQNRPSRLLQLLASVQQKPTSPLAAVVAVGGDGYHLQQPAPVDRRPSTFGEVHHVPTGRHEGLLDNFLHFSPSLRQQVYAPQPPPRSSQLPRTIVRAPITRLQVSTITMVTSVVSTRAAASPGKLLQTMIHTLTATRLQTLAVVVTPTVVAAADGRTTTFYGQQPTTNAEIITDLSFVDDDTGREARLIGARTATPTDRIKIPKTGVNVTPLSTITVPKSSEQRPSSVDVVDEDHIAYGVSVLAPSSKVKLTTEQQISSSAKQQVPVTEPITTTTEKPLSQLQRLLRSRAEAHKRSALQRRSRLNSRNKNKRPSAPVEPISSTASIQESTSTDAPTTTARSTTSKSTAVTHFQPQQVPVYVERDGVLIILPSSADTSAAAAGGPVYRPTTPRAPSETSSSIAWSKPTQQPVPHTTSTTTAIAQTSAAPNSATGTSTVSGASIASPGTTESSTQRTLTGSNPFYDYELFEETVYASSPDDQREPSAPNTAGRLQQLADGTFIITASTDNRNPFQQAEQTGAQSQSAVFDSNSDSDRYGPVAVSYAVSTRVSER